MFSNKPVYLASFEVKLLAFVATWFFQVRRLSKWSPRYLTVSAWGTTVLLMYTGGQCPHQRVNVMCEDLVSFIFSLHFRVQVSIVRRWSWWLAEANVGSGWVVKMAVSSSKVLRNVVSDCGISAVYSVYNNGPMMLQWGTSESIGNGDEVSLLYVVTKYLDKNIEHRERQQVQTLPTIWGDNRPHNLSMPNTGKRTVQKKDTIECVHNYTST